MAAATLWVGREKGTWYWQHRLSGRGSCQNDCRTTHESAKFIIGVFFLANWLKIFQIKVGNKNESGKTTKPFWFRKSVCKQTANHILEFFATTKRKVGKLLQKPCKITESYLILILYTKFNFASSLVCRWLPTKTLNTIYNLNCLRTANVGIKIWRKPKSSMLWKKQLVWKS